MLMGIPSVIEVDGQAVAIQQPFTAREVLRLGGILGRGLVIRIDGGRASRFDPPEPVSFEQPTRPVFRTFRGTAHRLHVDGLRWDWGMPAISEVDVRGVAGIALDVRIRVDGTIRFLAPGELIDLTAVPPPRLRSHR